MSEPSSKHPYLDNIAKNFLENVFRQYCKKFFGKS